jgi:hypothetical protein
MLPEVARTSPYLADEPPRSDRRHHQCPDAVPITLPAAQLYAQGVSEALRVVAQQVSRLAVIADKEI